MRVQKMSCFLTWACTYVEIPKSRRRAQPAFEGEDECDHLIFIRRTPSNNQKKDEGKEGDSDAEHGSDADDGQQKKEWALDLPEDRDIKGQVAVQELGPEPARPTTHRLRP